MSYNPFPYFDLDYSPANLQRLRDQFDETYDMVVMADLTDAGIAVLRNRKGFVPRVNLRYRLFEDGWMLKNPRRGVWNPVEYPGDGGAFARLTRGLACADALIDGAHPVGTEIEATQVDNLVQPGFAQAAGYMHLDVHDHDFGNVPRVVNYDVQDDCLPTIYMDGYRGVSDPFHPFLVDNAALYAQPGLTTILPLPDGPQREYLAQNAHRLKRGRRFSVTRRHNQTPHGGDYVPVDAPAPMRRPFHRVAVMRPEGVPYRRILGA